LVNQADAPVVLSRPAGKKNPGAVEFYSMYSRSSSALVVRTWCEEGGVQGIVEEAVKLFADRGNPGAKTFKSAESLALSEYKRCISQKLKQGYSYVDGSSSSVEVEINFNEYLPGHIRTPKPIESISEKQLTTLFASGFARCTIKYDGIGLAIVHHSFGWEFYTLSGNRLTEKFPLHREWFEQSDFAVGTFLKAEAVLFTGETPWSIDFGRMNGRFSLATSTEETRQMIADGLCPEPCVVVYDILYRDGQSLAQCSYDERRAQLEFLPEARHGSGIISLAELADVSPDTWQQAHESMGIEGFVVVDGGAVIGEKLISYSSSPGRPSGHYKLKPYPSEDVVVYAARIVDGKPESVFVKQRYPLLDEYPKAGEWFACGRVSLHLNPDLMRRVLELVSKGEVTAVASNSEGEKISVDNESGVTVVINFASRFPSGKFRHAVFAKPHRFRNDPSSADYKAASECFAGYLVS
jgi:ATP-dependent DNA ligase